MPKTDSEFYAAIRREISPKTEDKRVTISHWWPESPEKVSTVNCPERDAVGWTQRLAEWGFAVGEIATESDPPQLDPDAAPQLDPDAAALVAKLEGLNDTFTGAISRYYSAKGRASRAAELAAWLVLPAVGMWALGADPLTAFRWAVVPWFFAQGVLSLAVTGISMYGLKMIVDRTEATIERIRRKHLGPLERVLSDLKSGRGV